MNCWLLNGKVYHKHLFSIVPHAHFDKNKTISRSFECPWVRHQNWYSLEHTRRDNLMSTSHFPSRKVAFSIYIPKYIFIYFAKTQLQQTFWFQFFHNKTIDYETNTTKNCTHDLQRFYSANRPNKKHLNVSNTTKCWASAEIISANATVMLSRFLNLTHQITFNNCWGNERRLPVIYPIQTIWECAYGKIFRVSVWNEMTIIVDVYVRFYCCFSRNTNKIDT